ncbi:hypothetical protein [Methylomonas rapida]|uniref:Uncharacterized protein n=1 Tax=Methylomonas rapida TaxID=2963939 RepID=A0ABY7GFL7_9GAMM|nr:hypothetical protein [Methylomonas rapida]WAR43624.1 hypothetical protein NM686_014720 [Methylomonas rapida]WAR45497.1 hypothetical protein NM686_003000 [Methylomonas rapida]
MNWQARADRKYQRIKQFYLSRGRTEEQWQAIAANPQKFNRVWRAMLHLPADDKPPPKECR